MDVQHRIASDGNQAYRPMIGGAENARDGPEAAPEAFGAGARTSNAIVKHSACQKLRSQPRSWPSSSVRPQPSRTSSQDFRRWREQRGPS